LPNGHQYPSTEELRPSDPVRLGPAPGVWAITRWEDCARVLHDARFSAELAQRLRRRRDDLPRSMLTSDPPEHTRLRAPVIHLFGRARLQQVRERAVAVAEELLDVGGRQRRIDLIGDYARPLVTQLFVELLGVAPDDGDRFDGLVAEASLGLDPLARGNAQSRASAGSDALRAYFAELVAERTRIPGDDLVSALVEAMAEDADVSEGELVSTCSLLVIGGHEPTVHVIGNGVYALLQRRDQLRRLREAPSLVPSAVEEFLRYDSPIQLAARVAREDVALGRATIRAGEVVLVLLRIANRDPAAFPAPDALDVTRARNKHIAFGAGVHRCAGASLAREIGRAGLECLLRTYPDVRSDGGDPDWRDSVVPRGLNSLPVVLA
jgi:pimeloyl-[acyl-carrier protein] synthase